MAKIKPFKAIRPNEHEVRNIAALPYDTYNREEAYEYVQQHPHSFLVVDRPETLFGRNMDMYSSDVYHAAKKKLEEWINEQRLIQEETECYYIYELTIGNRIQTGIICCVSADDFENGTVKKHEKTRENKEKDRVCHIMTCGSQTGLIFLACKHNDQIREIINNKKQYEKIYDFASEDNVRHRCWRISKKDDIAFLTESLKKIDKLYIADGHHRAASAVKVAKLYENQNNKNRKIQDYDKENKQLNAENSENEREASYVMSAIFMEEELKIYDYNRVIKDLNGYSKKEFFKQLEKRVEILEESMDEIHPRRKGEFVMRLGNEWILCRFLGEERTSTNENRRINEKERINENSATNVVESLDVSRLQNEILEPILGIKDPRTDKRIEFVGGIRGYEELRRRCDKYDAVAFAMFPTSIEEMMNVADAGLLMPPKSTWFEPKLRSGIFIHKIDESI